MDKLSTNKTMTTKEVAEALGVTTKTVVRTAKKCLPSKEIVNGKPTLWNEEDVSILLNEMKRNGNGSGARNDLTLTEVVKVTETSKSYGLRLQSIVSEAKTEADLQAVAKAGMLALQTMLENSQKKIEQLQVALDTSKSFASVKLMEKLNPNRKFDWRVLKNKSKELSCKIEKCIDQNYGEVNAYSKEVWEACYELDTAPWD